MRLLKTRAYLLTSGNKLNYIYDLVMERLDASSVLRPLMPVNN